VPDVSQPSVAPGVETRVPRSRTSRRWWSMAATCVAAVAGTTMVLGTPAYAEPPDVTVEHTKTCETTTGKWKILWKINNWIRSDSMYMSGIKNPDQFRFLEKPDATEKVLTDGDAVIPAATGDAVETFWGTVPGVGWLVQRRPGTARDAELTFSAGYHGGFGSPRTTTFSLGVRSCRIDGKASVAFVHGCDGTITARTANTRAKSNPVTFTVKAGGGFRRAFQVAAGETRATLVPAENATGVTVTTGTGRFGPVTWRPPATCAGAGASASPSCAAGVECVSPGAVAAAAGDPSSGSAQFGAADDGTGTAAGRDPFPTPVVAVGTGALMLLLGGGLLFFGLRRRRLADGTGTLSLPSGPSAPGHPYGTALPYAPGHPLAGPQGTAGPPPPSGPYPGGGPQPPAGPPPPGGGFPHPWQ
jgi:hypothetical protein